MAELLLFDLDGTLADTVEDLAGATNELLTALKRERQSVATIAGWVGNGMRMLVRRAVGNSMAGAPDGPDIDHAVGLFRQAYTDWNGRTARLYPGMREVLTTLYNSGVQLACVTNKPEDMARTLVNRLEIGHLFTTVVGGDTLPVRKPDPAVIRCCLQRMGVGNTASAIFIGDSETDIQTARRAGLRVIGVSWGYNHDTPIAECMPDAVIDRASALPAAIANLRTPQFDWQELARVTNGMWLSGHEPVAGGGPVAVSTDTRTVGPGQCFLCLRGENFDGHHFIDKAVGAGAGCVIVDTAPSQPPPVPVLVVSDTLSAYGALGQACRQTINGPVVGITGSSGKTSTRAFTSAVFRAGDCNPLETIGNTNNLVGVPQNLLRAEESHRAAVLELGTNAPGEIAALADIALPSIGILTSIGPVHLEGLGSVAGVAAEKAALLRALPVAGTAVIPGSLRSHTAVQSALPASVILVGFDHDADIHIEWHGDTLRGADFTLAYRGQRTRIKTRVAGRHQAVNAGLAVGAGIAAGIPFATAAAAIADVVLPGMRMRIEEHAGSIWINDAYNANPDSMTALIDWLAAIPEWRQNPNPILVLGDMFELGPTALDLHRRVLDHAVSALPGARILAVGGHMVQTAPASITAVTNRDTAVAILGQWLQPGSLIAVKASRGMRLESLVPNA